MKSYKIPHVLGWHRSLTLATTFDHLFNINQNKNALLKYYNHFRTRQRLAQVFAKDALIKVKTLQYVEYNCTEQPGIKTGNI